MILFADTSALIKLYIEENGSAAMAAKTRDARLALSVLAYAEAYATFARRLRESLLTPDEHGRLVERFEYDWQGVIVLPLRPALIGRLPPLVKAHPLRGADAVHLASALSLQQAGLEVVFAGADERLMNAARLEGLETFHPEHAEG